MRCSAATPKPDQVRRAAEDLGTQRHQADAGDGQEHEATIISGERDLLEAREWPHVRRQLSEQLLSTDRAIDPILREPAQVDLQEIDEELSEPVQLDRFDFSPQADGRSVDQ